MPQLLPASSQLVPYALRFPIYSAQLHTMPPRRTKPAPVSSDDDVQIVEDVKPAKSPAKRTPAKATPSKKSDFKIYLSRDQLSIFTFTSALQTFIVSLYPASETTMNYLLPPPRRRHLRLQKTPLRLRRQFILIRLVL